MSIKNNNILIANFLDWPKIKKYNYETPFYESYLSTGAGMCETNVFHVEDLKFHNSWDWLMSVIIKISDIKHYTLSATIEYLSEFYYRNSDNSDGLVDIKEFYEVIIEFIENQNKLKIKKEKK
jgi:hypothetical protein